jgi:hypothetical protein
MNYELEIRLILMYCSLECGAEAHKRHHYCLCVAHADFGQLVSDFKFYCLSIEGCGDNLLLLAQLLAVLNAESKDYSQFQARIEEMLTYTNGPFEQVARPPAGEDRDPDWVAWLAETLSEAFTLLSQALCVQSENFQQFFSNQPVAFDTCSRLLSVFELNNIDIALPSRMRGEVETLLPLTPNLIPILCEKEVVMRALWDDEARGVYDDDEEEEMEDDDQSVSSEEHCHDEHHVDEMLMAIRAEVAEIPVETLILEGEYPDFHGAGFFPSVARTNHSCEPNVSMDFDSGNFLVSCKVGDKKIQSGQELRMSYISRPDQRTVVQRRHQLRDYLFECACAKCERESVIVNHRAM